MEWLELLRTNWRGFFSFFGHTKISLYKPTFTPLPKIALWSKKMLLAWASRKTRGVWPLKSQEVGEQNWVYYERFGEAILYEKVRWKRPLPTLPARHVTQTYFYFNPTSEIGIPDGCLAFHLLEQIYSLCGGGWMGIAELCIGRAAAAEHVTQARTPTFTPLQKIAFWS